MKQIKVDSCKNCPYHSFLLANTCKHSKIKGMLIKDINKINEYCPLEDLNEPTK